MNATDQPWIEFALQLLRDPITSAISILVALFIYWRQRQVKGLMFGIGQSRIVAISNNLNGRIVLSVDGVPRNNVWSIILAIECTGNLPIRRDDYDQPITFSFPGEGVEILAAELVRRRPSDLNVQVSFQSCEIRVEPTMLNPRDSFSIQVLISDYKEAVVASGRIAGVSALERVHGPIDDPLNHAAKKSDKVVGATALIASFIFFYFWIETGNPSYAVMALSGIGLCFLILASPSFRRNW